MTNSNMKKRISGIAKGNKTNLTQNDGCLKTVDDTISHQKTYNILIVTRGRSGSSFLGDLLNSYPGSFYIFEPLHKKNEYERMNKKTIKGNKVIESIFKCELPELPNFIWRNFGPFEKLKEKASIWKTSTEKSKASNQIFSNTCKKFPKRLVKTIRLPFEDAEYLLLDPEIGKNLKVIFLFRDPRGRYQSLISKVNTKKNYKEWCQYHNISYFCNEHHVDVKAAMNIQNQYPGKRCFYSIDKHIAMNLYLKSNYIILFILLIIQFQF